MEKYYKIDIFISYDYKDNLFAILEDTKDYDMIHFFWRKLLLQLDSEEFKTSCREKSYSYEEYLEKISKKISTGIYDHLFLEDESILQYQNIFTKYCKSYYTCSKKLQRIYEKISSYPNPWGTIHDTYDDELYTGGDKTRFDKRKNPLVVGWVGNSNWNIKYKDFKGFHTILNPVLDSLIEEEYEIKKYFADKNERFRTNEEMPAYYQELDVCVITSTEEGTPRPILEAMASGTPIITTNVGIVEEVFGPKQMKFVIGTRTEDNTEEIRKKLKEKLIELYENRSLLKELSKENYEYTKKNGIESLKEEYHNYFQDFLKEEK